MKIDQQKSLLTVMAIMGTAFILFSMGCGSSKNVKPALEAKPVAQETNTKRPTNPSAEADQSPIDQAKDPNKVKECSAAEFSDLKTLKTALADSDQQIKSLGDQKKWTLNSKVLQSSQKSALLCEKLLSRHRPAACKKTIAEDIYTIYSYKKIKSECELSQKYYNQFKTAQTTQPVKPPVKQPDAPVVIPDPSVPETQPPVVQQPQIPTGTYPTCTTAEFQKLSSWSAELDSANKNISRLGSKSQWKYDSAAISTATSAKKSCEVLISYHSQSPCQKSIKQADGSSATKTYDQNVIRQRCETARTYFYEFTQRTSTLNEKNADLYLDISRFNQKVFEAQEQKSYQNCVVQNPTDSRIDYTNQKALVVSSRGFEDKIMVLETQEGLLLQCYSLGLDGPFSKRQVVNNLNLDKTYINLEYILK